MEFKDFYSKHMYGHSFSVDFQDDIERVDIMLDIETFGTGSDAFIFQVSAVPFNLLTGEIYNEACFNQVVDLLQENELKGVNGRTLLWWLEDVKRDLLKELLDAGEYSLNDVLVNFSNYIKHIQDIVGKESVHVWGNGVMFDNNKMQRQMEVRGIDYPVFYKCDKDMRTLVDLYCTKTGVSKSELNDIINKQFKDKRIELKEHDALDDCWYQIEGCKYCWNELIK